MTKKKQNPRRKESPPQVAPDRLDDTQLGKVTGGVAKATGPGTQTEDEVYIGKR